MDWRNWCENARTQRWKPKQENKLIESSKLNLQLSRKKTVEMYCLRSEKRISRLAAHFRHVKLYFRPMKVSAKYDMKIQAVDIKTTFVLKLEVFNT